MSGLNGGSIPDMRKPEVLLFLKLYTAIEGVQNPPGNDALAICVYLEKSCS